MKSNYVVTAARPLALPESVVHAGRRFAFAGLWLIERSARVVVRLFSEIILRFHSSCDGPKTVQLNLHCRWPAGSQD
jgi:hypothetical protein